MKERDTVKKEETQKQEEARHAGHHRWDFLVAIVCVLLAFLVWLCVMNVRDTEFVTLKVKDQLADYTYEISVNSIEIEGRLATLRNVDALQIALPTHTEGTHTIGEEYIVLPEGVSLAGGARSITVTVRAK